MAKANVRKAKPTTTSRRAAAKPTRAQSVMGLPLTTWVQGLRRAKGAEARSGQRGFVFVFGANDTKVIKKVMAGHLNKWQLSQLMQSEAESSFFQGAGGPLWVLRPQSPGGNASPSSLEKSRYARIRDLTGAVVPALGAYKPEKLLLEFHGLSVDEERAAIIGLEIAAYSFQENRGELAPSKARKVLPSLLLKEASPALDERAIRASADVALAVNIARHYVNLPASDLNPRTYAESIEALFSGSSTVEVEIWAGAKLQDERMNLLLAVGGAAADGPRFVHLRYRPKTASAGRPVAIVGKGITFDSGGLDIKPSSGMRLMKKDMGGSAAAIAIAKWAERSDFSLPLDIYVSLAENAVGSRSFRPGDVITARNGMTIEISNTDAEGRLVLADALDVAVNQAGGDQPAFVLDVATLTGAIKVGLGAEVAGLFSNSDHLAQILADAGLSRGDLMWRMPLVQAYRSQLKSNFADVLNCSEGGFGGAITAALFLESFVKGVPWAHLDIYAWRDSASGAWTEAGGSGQPVQALTEALTRMAEEADGEGLA